MTDTLQVEIWRGTETGSFQAFAIPRREHQTVLDVVTEIQREHDATLSYRFACRVGMCGSCAMVVNGRPRWTCRTRVREVVDGERLRLEPLRKSGRRDEPSLDRMEADQKSPPHAAARLRVRRASPDRRSRAGHTTARPR